MNPVLIKLPCLSHTDISHKSNLGTLTSTSPQATSQRHLRHLCCQNILPRWGPCCRTNPLHILRPQNPVMAHCGMRPCLPSDTRMTRIHPPTSLWILTLSPVFTLNSPSISATNPEATTPSTRSSRDREMIESPRDRTLSTDARESLRVWRAPLSNEELCRCRDRVGTRLP